MAPWPFFSSSFCAECIIIMFSSNGSYPALGPDPPRWSSSTLGAMSFMHGGDDISYNATQLQTIAKFAMAQFDKKCNIASMPGVAYEDRAIAAAQAIKATAPHIKTLL